MRPIGPLVLSPRLDAKPWGGHGLARFGFDLPAGERIGEALITIAGARIVGGYHAGRTLGDLVAADPRAMIGERGLKATRGQPRFPLLVKLIDATQNLSIQVHPPDSYAPLGQLGKSEAWHVLDAEAGALLYLGFREGTSLAEVERSVRAGVSIAHLMRTVPAVPGMTVSLRAGAVHALGAGVTIYEIQQPSEITYRLDDWGRVDSAGRSRELHIDESFAVLEAEERPEPIPPVPLPIACGMRERLVLSPLFAAERIFLPDAAEGAFDGEDAPQVFTILAGAIHLTAAESTVLLEAGQSAAIPACSGAATLTARGDCTLFRAWLDPAGAGST